MHLSLLTSIIGPKLASGIDHENSILILEIRSDIGLALTHWYEGYYEVWLGPTEMSVMCSCQSNQLYRA